MGTVVSVLLRIQGDASSALASLRSMQSALSGLGSGFRTSTAGVSAASGAFGLLTASTRTIGSVMKSVFTGVFQATGALAGGLLDVATSGFFLINGLEALGQVIEQTGQFFTSASADIETARLQYEYLLGSVEKANARIAEIQTVNLKSPLDLQQLIQADRLLETFGVRTKRLFQDVADAAAGSRPAFRDYNDQLQIIVNAIDRIASGDTGRGLLALKKAGVVTPVDLKDVGIQFTGNKVTSDINTVMDGIQKVIEKRFGGIGEAMSMTFAGAVSNIKDRFYQLQAILGQPIIDTLTPFFRHMVDVLGSPEIVSKAALFGNAVAAGMRIAGSAVSQLITDFTPLANAIGSFVQKATGGLTEFAGMVSAAFVPLENALQSVLAGDFQGALQQTRVFLQDLGYLFIFMLNNLAPQLFSGGTNIIASMAQGILAGVGFVVSAVTSIANIIASFLQGHSPPEAGPLHTIDKWFPMVINSYLSSWSQADWGMLTELTDYIAGRFEWLVQQGQMSATDAMNLVIGTNQTEGLNQMIAEATNQIATTGHVTAEKLAQIEALLGDANKQIFEQLKARFQQGELDHQITALQARLAALNDPAAAQRLQDATTAAQKQLDQARTYNQFRAAREQLAQLKAQKDTQDAQKTVLDQQIAALQAQRTIITAQIAGYQAMEHIQQAELDFMQKVLATQQASVDAANQLLDAQIKLSLVGADSSKQLDALIAKQNRYVQGSLDWVNVQIEIKTLQQQQVQAQFDYDFALASSTKKLQMLRDEQRQYTRGSVEYLALASKIADLVAQRQQAEDQFNLAQDDSIQKLAFYQNNLAKTVKGSVEWYAIEQQIIDLKQAEVDAQFQLDLLNMDSVQQAQALTKELSRYHVGSVERLKLETQIAGLQKQQADAAFQFALAQTDTAGQLALTQGQLSKVTVGSVEYYALQTSILQLTKQQADEEKARAAAELQFYLATHNTFEQRARLQEQLSKLNVNDPKQASEYYDVLARITALDKSRSDAQFEYDMLITDTDGKLKLLQDRLATFPAKSEEWYGVQKQIYDLQQQQQKQAADLAKQLDDANFAYKMALADDAGQVALLAERAGKYQQGSLDWYQAATNYEQALASFRDKQKREAEQVAGALFDYKLELADTAGKIALLSNKAAGLNHNSVEYYQTLIRIHQLQQQQQQDQLLTPTTNPDDPNNPIDPISKAIADGKKRWDDLMAQFDAGKQKLLDIQTTMGHLLDPFTTAYDQNKGKVDGFFASLTPTNWGEKIGRIIYDGLLALPAIIMKFWIDHKKDFEDSFKGFMTNFSDWVTANAPEFGTQAGRVAGYILDAIIKILVGAGTIIFDVASWVQQWLQNGGVEKTNQSMGAVELAIKNFFKEAWKVAGPDAIELADALGFWLQDIITLGIQHLPGLFAQAVTNQTQGKPFDPLAGLFPANSPQQQAAVEADLQAFIAWMWDRIFSLFGSWIPTPSEILNAKGGNDLFSKTINATLDKDFLLTQATKDAFVAGFKRFATWFIEALIAEINRVLFLDKAQALQDGWVAWVNGWTTPMFERIDALFGTHLATVLGDGMNRTKDDIDPSVQALKGAIIQPLINPTDGIGAQMIDAFFGSNGVVATFQRLYNNPTEGIIAITVEALSGTTPTGLLYRMNLSWSQIADNVSQWWSTSESPGGIRNIIDMFWNHPTSGVKNLTSSSMSPTVPGSVGDIMNVNWGLMAADALFAWDNVGGVPGIKQIINDVWTNATSGIIVQTSTNMSNTGPGGLGTIMNAAWALMSGDTTNAWDNSDGTGIKNILWDMWTNSAVGIIAQTALAMSSTDKKGLGFIIADAWTVIMTLWTDETKRQSYADAILWPFKTVRDAIYEIFKAIGNHIIGALVAIMSRYSSFIVGIKSGVNWIGGKLGLGDVIKDTPEAVTITTMPDAPPLRMGTRNWKGGWARTGEAESEIAILPRARDQRGNYTYLPPGSQVLNQQQLGRGAGITSGDPHLPQLAGALGADPFFGLPAWVLDAYKLVTGGFSSIVDHIISDAGSTAWGGAFDQIGVGVLSSLTLGIETKVVEIINRFLDAWHLPGHLNAPGSPSGGTGGAPGFAGLANALGLAGSVMTTPFSAAHQGLDFAGRAWGTPVLSFEGGKITVVDTSVDYGNRVQAKAATGRKYYWGHLSAFKVASGQDIQPGAVIGLLGNTGRLVSGTQPPDHPGTHLHFQMSDLAGNWRNPLDMWTDYLSRLGGSSGADGTSAWPGTTSDALGWLLAALNVTGSPADWLRPLSIVAKFESGDDPFAKNLQDSNARLGFPSRGIMQTIPQTFNKWKRALAGTYQEPYGVDGSGNDLTRDPGSIYDPIENIIAALYYIIRGKGPNIKTPWDLQGVKNVLAGLGYVGYAAGGIISEPILGKGLLSGKKYSFGEMGSEMIVPINDQMKAMLAGITQARAIGPFDRIAAGALVQGQQQDSGARPVLLNYNPHNEVSGVGLGVDGVMALIAQMQQKDRENMLSQLRAMALGDS